MGTALAPATISADDKVVFVESIRPPLRAGDYRATVTQTIRDPEGHDPDRKEDATSAFSVAGDRWALAQGMVEQMFPPKGSSGPFDRALPHVVLKRETLPWERSPHGEGHEEPLTPSWLALLVFTGDEIPEIDQVLSGELEKDRPAANDVAVWSAPPEEVVHDPKLPAIVIRVGWDRLKKQIPTYEDLGLCAHVRKVELPNGAVLNARAVVVAQRLVKPGERCAVHLVSLEHRYVRETGAAAPAPGPVTDLLNEAWKTIESQVDTLETPQKDRKAEGRRASNRLKTLEVEVRIREDAAAEILAPAVGNFAAVALEGKAASTQGALDDGTLVVTRAGKPTVLDDKGRRKECDELFADFTPPSPAPAKTPAKVPEAQPKLASDLAALLKNRPGNTVRAHLRDGMPPVYFVPAACASKATPKDTLDAVLPDETWHDRLQAKGAVRFERWWVFGGVPRRLVVEAIKTAKGIDITLTLRPQARLCFRHDGDDTKRVELVSLHNWTFQCDVGAAGHFGQRAKAILPADSGDGCLRLPLPEKSPSPDALRFLPDVREGVAMPADGEAWLQRGYVALPHSLRTGETTVSWYRGPLAPALSSPPPQPELPASCADALLLFDPKLAMFDASWAAAWELGRQLALADRKFSHALALWKKSHREAQYALRQRADMQYISVAHPRPTNTEIPAEIADRLDRLALLEGVPFGYLVPDERMLPRESLRFFTVDPGWIESLRDGAMSIARAHLSDHARHTVHREQLAAVERISGVIIRSSIVKDWPDLCVRGWVQTAPGDDKWHTAPDLSGHPYRELTAVRQAHLGPDIVLVLFEDPTGSNAEINVLELHVQPQMLHFGLEGEPGKWTKHLRDPKNGEMLTFESQEANLPGETVTQAVLTLDALKKLVATNGLEKEIKDALDRRAKRWTDHRVWTDKELDQLRAGIPSAQTKLDAAASKKVADLMYAAATKTVVESVPVRGIVWRDEASGVLDLANLFQLLSDRMRPVIGDRAVTTADFALQMLDAPAVVRVLRELV